MALPKRVDFDSVGTAGPTPWSDPALPISVRGALLRAHLPVVSLLRVPIVNATKDEASALIDAWVRERNHTRAVYFANAHTLNLAWEDPGYRAILADADAVFGDGTGVRWAARMQRVEMRDNLVGTDLLPHFITTAARREYRYFLLGGAPHTASRAAAHLARQYSGIRVVGHHHGYLSRSESRGIVSMINSARPDLLLVGMGNPLQETWIHNHREALQVPVCLAVGGLLDHWAGHLRRAPRWVRRLGMEWVQLLFQQPHKWRRYVLGNPKFLTRALRDIGRPIGR